VKLFGLTLWPDRTATEQEKAVAGTWPVSVSGSRGWHSLIREPFAGAWQRNIAHSRDSILNYSAVFRCISLISSDVAKLRLRLVAKDANGIWEEVENSAHTPVLRRPNRYQNRIQFIANWLESKLISGNTYVLKERDARNVVARMYILDPNRVTVLVGDDGSVYYELHSDNLTGLRTPVVTVPASEVIHDRFNTVAHPLVGTSPITAAGLAALQGIQIQENSSTFFSSGSNPGGILSAPGKIDDATARRLKEYWDENYGTGGPNVGKVAVLGDGLQFSTMAISASDSQLLEQLKWTAETVASVFGVPAHMIGIGQPPTYNNIESLQTQYYSQCLQFHIESIELALDEGLELGRNTEGRVLGTEFDLEDLLRMDTKTKMEVIAGLTQRGVLAPNEGRFVFNLKPVTGGESPYLQVQNYSLEALAERDKTSAPTTPGLAPPQPAAEASRPNVPREEPENEDEGNEGPERTVDRYAAIAYLQRRMATEMFPEMFRV
jgi:HK97 family phage portal protein